MGSKRVTVTVDSFILGAAQRLAEEQGMSLSAYVGRAVRRQALGDSMRAEAAYLAQHPEVRAQMELDAEQDELERELSRAAEAARGQWRSAA